MIIGLTGLTGAGKSTAAGILQRRGWHVVDADAVSRRVTERPDILGKIQAAFGSACIGSDGRLNRRALAAIVFNDAEKLRLLNSVTHGPIVDEILAEVKAHEGENTVIDAPLLVETGLDRSCGAVLRITAPEELRAERIMKRDGLSLDEARARIRSQAPAEGSFIDIDNSAGEDALAAAVDEALRRISEQGKDRE